MGQYAKCNKGTQKPGEALHAIMYFQRDKAMLHNSINKYQKKGKTEKGANLEAGSIRYETNSINKTRKKHKYKEDLLYWMWKLPQLHLLG